jgi:hypothetical protein
VQRGGRSGNGKYVAESKRLMPGKQAAGASSWFYWAVEVASVVVAAAADDCVGRKV